MLFLLPVLLIVTVLVCWRLLTRTPKPTKIPVRVSPDGTSYPVLIKRGDTRFTLIDGNRRMSAIAFQRPTHPDELDYEPAENPDLWLGLTEPHTIIGQGEYARRIVD